MKNKLKYFYLGKRTEIDIAIQELAEGIDYLYGANGQYNKETDIDPANEKPVDAIFKLSKEIRQLAADFDNTRMELLGAESEIQILKEEAEAGKKQLDELKKQLDGIKTSQIQKTDSNMEQIMDEIKRPSGQEKDKRLKLVLSLIKFRDQLLIFRDNTEDEAAAKLLMNLYKETGRFMNENEIELLNKGGNFSTDYQIVVGTSVTDKVELSNTIESTFRDGYIVDGDMIRPQEVVVYVHEKSPEV